MSKRAQSAAPAAGAKRRVHLERTFQAPIADVWSLWTTKDGIESWWGPDGFRVEVQKLDLRPGGQLVYLMIAEGPEQVAFMKRAGMPVAHQAQLTYTEIVPQRRLAYRHLTDFVPGVEPYDVDTLVELHQEPHGVRMALSFDVMHDAEWTERATMGWEMELGKLAKVLAGSRP